MKYSKPNIALAGFMGTGKTTVGRCLAGKMSMSFVDMDDLIVEREGKSITRIFAEEGEPEFRAIERNIVKELSTKSNMVISTGGGIVLNKDNVNDFCRSGLMICLSTRPETILARLESDKTRPLLEGQDKLAKITQNLEKRKHLYNAIPLQISTDDLTTDQVCEQIIKIYKSQYNNM